MKLFAFESLEAFKFIHCYWIRAFGWAKKGKVYFSISQPTTSGSSIFLIVWWAQKLPICCWRKTPSSQASCNNNILSLAFDRETNEIGLHIESLFCCVGCFDVKYCRPHNKCRARKKCLHIYFFPQRRRLRQKAAFPESWVFFPINYRRSRKNCSTYILTCF